MIDSYSRHRIVQLERRVKELEWQRRIQDELLTDKCDELKELSAWVRTRPRSPAPPHANPKPTENSNHEEG